MATFIVEHRLPGLSREHLDGVHRALAESSRRLSTRSDRVRYVWSLVVPARGACVCVFEATSSELVRRVNEVAQVPFATIDEALAFESPGAAGQRRHRSPPEETGGDQRRTGSATDGPSGAPS